TLCACPLRLCERTCWPWNDMGTPCCDVSGQGAGWESGEGRRTHTTDSGTWERADGRTFGVAHGPTGLYAPQGRRNRGSLFSAKRPGTVENTQPQCLVNLLATGIKGKTSEQDFGLMGGPGEASCKAAIRRRRSWDGADGATFEWLTSERVVRSLGTDA